MNLLAVSYETIVYDTGTHGLHSLSQVVNQPLAVASMTQRQSSVRYEATTCMLCNYECTVACHTQMHALQYRHLHDWLMVVRGPLLPLRVLEDPGRVLEGAAEEGRHGAVVVDQQGTVRQQRHRKRRHHAQDAGPHGVSRRVHVYHVFAAPLVPPVLPLVQQLGVRPPVLNGGTPAVHLLVFLQSLRQSL